MERKDKQTTRRSSIWPIAIAGLLLAGCAVLGVFLLDARVEVSNAQTRLKEAQADAASARNSAALARNSTVGLQGQVDACQALVELMDANFDRAVRASGAGAAAQALGDGVLQGRAIATLNEVQVSMGTYASFGCLD